MSHIEALMHELNLSPDTISETLNKVDEICQHGRDESAGKSFYIRLNGNGDGDGDGDN